MFIDYCLVHFVGSLTWRWQAYVRNLSDNEDGCDDDEDAIDEFDWDRDDTTESEESSTSSGDCTMSSNESISLDWFNFY
jgi:hypothetical protein